MEPLQALDTGRALMAQEAAAVAAAGRALGADFVACVEHLAACAGHVVVLAVGKSGHVGQKISATLASIGTPSFFLHATEAVHGDLGRLRPGDVVLALSNSGETAELTGVLPALRSRGVTLLALTSRADSTLGRAADCVLATGEMKEACPLQLVPTVSTTVALALGDALAMALFARAQQKAETYAQRHPGGVLGHKLKRVGEVMRTAVKNPVVRQDASLGQVLAVMTDTPGNPGAACVVDAEGVLIGLFTDGDLRRLVQEGPIDAQVPVRCVMHAKPRCIDAEARLIDAAARLAAFKIDQLPVVDAAGRPIGLLDVQDVLRA